MSIYTRTGDDGTTSLYGGKRVLKCEELVDVYGSIDELNSWIGLLIFNFPRFAKASRGKQKSKMFLEYIQEDLLMIGSKLAGWKGDIAILASRVKEMETHIDAYEKDLPEIKNFILPGGTELGSLVHIVRSICRRVERQTVAFFNSRSPMVSFQQKDKDILLKYLNRLSDLFFTLARFINKKAGIEETKWSGLPRK